MSPEVLVNEMGLERALSDCDNWSVARSFAWRVPGRGILNQQHEVALFKEWLKFGAQVHFVGLGEIAEECASTLEDGNGKSARQFYQGIERCPIGT